jgi:hypothetical protein
VGLSHIRGGFQQGISPPPSLTPSHQKVRGSLNPPKKYRCPSPNSSKRPPPNLASTPRPRAPCDRVKIPLQVILRVPPSRQGGEAKAAPCEASVWGRGQVLRVPNTKDGARYGHHPRKSGANYSLLCDISGSTQLGQVQASSQRSRRLPVSRGSAGTSCERGHGVVSKTKGLGAPTRRGAS